MLTPGDFNEHPARTRLWFRQPSIPYRALSYEWGPPGDTHLIEIDGAPFRVRANLMACLKQLVRLRYGDIVRGKFYIWIDAICIDQNDVVEKSFQVQMMASIFASARRVYMWLGYHPTINMEGMQDFITATMAFARYLTTKDMSPEESIQTHVVPYPRPETPCLKFWNFTTPAHIFELTRLSYWNRRWIMQEIFVAQRLAVLCNDRMLDYDFLRDFVTKSMPYLAATLKSGTKWKDEILPAHFDLIEPVIRWLGEEFDPWCCIFTRLQDYRKMERPFTDNKPLKSLTVLLFSFSNTECFLDLDRVYAIRAFMPDPDLVKVDYAISAPQLAYDLLQAHIPFTSANAIELCKELRLSDTMIDPVMDMMMTFNFAMTRPVTVVRVDSNWTTWNICAWRTLEVLEKVYERADGPADTDGELVEERPFPTARGNWWLDQLPRMKVPKERFLATNFPSIALTFHQDCEPFKGCEDYDELSHMGQDDYMTPTAVVWGSDGLLYNEYETVKVGDILLMLKGNALALDYLPHKDRGIVLGRQLADREVTYAATGVYYCDTDRWHLDRLKRSEALFERYEALGDFDDLGDIIVSDAKRKLQQYNSWLEHGFRHETEGSGEGYEIYANLRITFRDLVRYCFWVDIHADKLLYQTTM